MSEEKPAEGVATPENEPPASTQAPTAISPVSNSQDRTELLSRARNFLLSPQIIHQDTSAKRKFLADKGLDESEINGILQGLVSESGLWTKQSLIALLSLFSGLQFRPGHIHNSHLRTYLPSS